MRHAATALGGLLLAAASTGCGNDTVWLLQIENSQPEECENEILHNFTGGLVNEGDAEWTTESFTIGSDDFRFAHLIETSRNTGVLVIGQQAFPGTKESGRWRFEAVDSVGTADIVRHTSGYAYGEFIQQRTTWEISLGKTKGTWGGDFERTTELAYTWQENDTWTDSAAIEVGFTGQIPSDAYLLRPSEDGTTNDPAVNTADTTDCDSADGICELQDFTQCAQKNDFTAVRTKLDAEEAYAGVAGATSDAPAE